MAGRCRLSVTEKDKIMGDYDKQQQQDQGGKPGQDDGGKPDFDKQQQQDQGGKPDQGQDQGGEKPGFEKPDQQQ